MLRKLMMDPYLEKTSLKGGKFVVVRNGEAGVSWDAEGCKDMSYLLEKHEVEQDETSIKATWTAIAVNELLDCSIHIAISIIWPTSSASVRRSCITYWKFLEHLHVLEESTGNFDNLIQFD
jgi:hypothetical protein